MKHLKMKSLPSGKPIKMKADVKKSNFWKPKVAVKGHVPKIRPAWRK